MDDTDTMGNVEEFAVVADDGGEVAAVAAARAHAARIQQALEATGYRIEPLVVDHGTTDPEPATVHAAPIDLDAECTPDDHHACDVKVAIAVATEVAAEANLPSYGKLRAIQDRGVVSETEAEAVLREWAGEVQAAPEASAEHRDWAAVVAEELWPAPPARTNGE